jgi:putative transposase
MIKAVKIRLYPNKTQSSYINRLCGSYRKIYNMCLEKKITAYTLDKTTVTFGDLGKYFHQDLTKNTEFSYLNEHNTKVLKQSIIDLMDAYKRFFINNTGFPKYKSKHDSKQSARFPLEAISKLNSYTDNKITLGKNLQKVGFECSDRDKNYLTNHKDKIKSATISRTKSDKYFLSILIENIIEPVQKPLNDIIGIDIGIKDFMVCSDGQVFDSLKLKRLNEKILIKLQRQLSKKTIGSHNRYKIKLKLAKKHEKLNNIKLNYIHNITTQLVRENQTIVIEDLNVKGMLKNHCLAKSIQDLSIYETFRQLKYKSEWYGRDLIIIDRWFPSSKLCNVCGYKYKELSLKERYWTCPDCGTQHDRDYNAATNIKNEGQRILKNKIGTRYPEFTLVDYPTMDDRLSNKVLKSSDRLNQEEKSTNSERSELRTKFL